MAEFAVVMKHAKRMCEAHSECDNCSVRDVIGTAGCPFLEAYIDRAGQIERVVMDWAEKHPEPKYPTWIEWWNENFSSKGRRMLTPCSFVPPAELGCSIGMDGCMNAPYKCWHTPIPANVAKKLNIKPIGG